MKTTLTLILLFATAQFLYSQNDSIYHTKGISIGEIRNVNSDYVRMKIYIDITDTDFGINGANVNKRTIPKMYDYKTKNVVRISFSDKKSIYSNKWNEIKGITDIENVVPKKEVSINQSAVTPINEEFSRELALTAKYSNRSANYQILSIVSGLLAIGASSAYSKQIQRKATGQYPTYENFYKNTSILLYSTSGVFYISSIVSHKKAALHLSLASDYAGLGISIPIK